MLLVQDKYTELRYVSITFSWEVIIYHEAG